MLWSTLFIPTLRESPAEAEAPGDQLLLRAGYIRQAAAGSYSYLFLAQRSLEKIARIVRAEMDAIGAQEMLLPAAQPHEEAVATIARGGLRSYKQLPQIWYHARFPASDSFSFDVDAAGLDAAYEKHERAYGRILERCGIGYVALAGSLMAEFEGGEDALVQCAACGYRANSGRAEARAAAPLAPDPEGELAPEAFHTPGRKTIADVSEFTGLPATSQIKSLVLVANRRTVLVLVRGDHQLSEAKFGAVTGDPLFRPAQPAEIREALGADAGSLGPVGVKGLTILADDALRGRRNMICGANQDDYHLRHVTPEEDFQPEFHDLRQVEAGEACAACGAPLEKRRAMEVGHLRKLGSRYPESMGLHVTNAGGAEVAPCMGGYGIAIDRILRAGVALSHDKDGMCLPPAIAPFSVVITPVNIRDVELKRAAEEIHRACGAAGLEALLDDRDERPGVKFKDADLIGVPYRITVGKKLASGFVELVERRGRQSADVAVADAAAAVAARLGGGRDGN